MEKIMELDGEDNPFYGNALCVVSFGTRYNSMSRLAAPNSKKNIISTIERPGKFVRRNIFDSKDAFVKGFHESWTLIMIESG